MRGQGDEVPWDGVGSGWKQWLEGALGLFYPPVCQVCRQEAALARDGYVGAECRREVRWIQPPFCDRCGLPFEGAITTEFKCSNCSEQTLHFSTARAVVVASGVVRDVLHGYKYRRAVWFEPFLGRLLVQGAGAAVAAAGYDLLVPVPLHPVKRREREFNQAERLARRLSRAMKIPVRTDLVHRQHPTLSQTARKREIPEGLWTKCPGCATMIFDKELDQNQKVCSRCGHHFQIGARERIHALVETCSFEEMDAD
jgi:predicted amidophosphoribosyltransferase